MSEEAEILGGLRIGTDAMVYMDMIWDNNYPVPYPDLERPYYIKEEDITWGWSDFLQSYVLSWAPFEDKSIKLGVKTTDPDIRYVDSIV